MNLTTCNGWDGDKHIKFKLKEQYIHINFQQILILCLNNFYSLKEKYSRLNSLEKANLEHLEKLKNLSEVDLMKMQPEIGENGRKLARMILEFDTVLNNSLQKMEPSPIAIHLVTLNNYLK